jgi:hypothetical protein
MPSSGVLRRVALVKIDVSDECSASIIRVTRISELGIKNYFAAYADCVLWLKLFVVHRFLSL